MSTSADRFGWCRYLGADSGAGASVALALDIFTPRNPPELRRAIRRHGALLVVTPMASHLSEVRHALRSINIDARKDARLADAFARYFRCSEYGSLTWQMTLNAEDVLCLAMMGLLDRHIDAHDLSHRVTLLPLPVAVTAAGCSVCTTRSDIFATPNHLSFQFRPTTSGFTSHRGTHVRLTFTRPPLHTSFLRSPDTSTQLSNPDTPSNSGDIRKLA